MPATIRLDRVAYSYAAGRDLFCDLTTHIPTGWTGVVGANGSGKTTLLRLIASDLTPDAGGVRLVPSGGHVVYCPQRVERADPRYSDLAVDDTATASELRARLGLTLEQLSRWDTLSPGERKRWQLGYAMAQRPDVLLVDEPTNHLDAEARELLGAVLQTFDGTGLLVSHDRDLLDTLTKQTLHISQGGDVRLYHCAYTQAAELMRHERAQQQREAEQHAEMAARARRQELAARDTARSAELARSTRARQRNPGDREAGGMLAKNRAEWASARASRTVAVSSARTLRAEQARETHKTEPSYEGTIHFPFEPPRRNLLLELHIDALRAGEQVLAQDLHLFVHRSSRVHVAGPNGSGKSTLLAQLSRISTLPADRTLWLPQELTHAQESALMRRTRCLAPDQRGRLSALLARLGADPAAVLSGDACSPGEARKLMIAEALTRSAWLLVLDEPTNHLDLPSIEHLQAALREYRGAIVMTTHDSTFAAAICKTTWEFAGRRLTVSGEP